MPQIPHGSYSHNYDSNRSVQACDRVTLNKKNYWGGGGYLMKNFSLVYIRFM